MTAELLNVIVTSREEQGAGIIVLELNSNSEKALPIYTAGAHIDVHVDSNVIRQYSLCNKPGIVSGYRIGVLNDANSRGGSVKIYDYFMVGKIFQISAPRNHFALDNRAEVSLLIAGGIGITPLIAMAYDLENQGKEFELHYCLRSRGAGAFVNELEKQLKDKVIFHYDDEEKAQLLAPETLFNRWNGIAHIYVCGPTGFMNWVIENAKSCGYSDKQIHFEYFNAEVDASGEEFDVHCAKSNVTVHVGSKQTIVEALAAAGINVQVSCEQGVCGTCITDVLEGEPDHRDSFLTDEEKADNDQMALCCSRAKTQRLLIDL